MFSLRTKEHASLLLEVLTKSAVQGPAARVLADLYEQAKAAVDRYGS